MILSKVVVDLVVAEKVQEADLEVEGRGDRGPVRFTENATQAQRRAAGRVEAVACTTKVYGLIDSQHTSSARRKWV